MKFLNDRIIISLLLIILTATSLFSQEWVQGRGFPVWVSVIEVAKYDSSTVFIGTTKMGIWRRDFSTDEGWHQITNGYPEREYTEEEMIFSGLWYSGDYHEVLTIETNQNLPGVIYVGGNGNRVYRSANNGDSWEEWGVPRELSTVISSIEIVSSIPEKVLATSRYTYMNNNQDTEWTFFPVASNSESSDSTIMYVNEDPHVDGRLIAGVRDWSEGYTFLMESYDYGDEWTQLSDEDFSYWEDSYHDRLFFDPTDSLRMYLHYSDTGEFEAILTTDNGGTSWYSSPHPNQYSYGFVRAVDHNGTLYATENWQGGTFFKSSDQLFSFYYVPMVAETEALDAFLTKYVEFVGTSETFIAGGRWGIYKSDDAGDTFYNIDHGVNKGYVEKVEPVSDNENSYFAYSESGVFKSSDGGQEWIRVISDDITTVNISPVDNNIVLACGHSGRGIWKSENGGDTWSLLSTTQTPREIIWIPTSTDTLFSTDYYRTRIRKSTNCGVDWELIYEHDAVISRLFMHPVYNNKFWAASDVVMYSSDYCETWTFMGTTPDEVLDIFVLESDTSRVFITCENENIYKLHSNGLGWINISEDLPRESWSHLGEMKPIPDEDAFLLVVKGQGIYHFNCDTEEWILYEGDYDPRVTDVAINDFGKIIISTSSDGVFVGDYVTPVSAVDPNINPELPTEVFLDDPYPNPFNSSVTIPFSLPTAAKVTLNVFDILGREVYKSSSHYSSGSHTKVLNSESDFVSNVASGIYFVQMKSASARLTKKVMLLH
jgi:Secretion system C-terminal sorting domain